MGTAQTAAVINVRSRKGRRAAESARRMLEDAGIVIRDWQMFRSTPALAAHVRSLVENKCDTIVVGGGDGTIAAAAGAIIGSQTVLAVLPLGTGNAFAKDIGINGLEDACEALSERSIAHVDTGDIDGRVLLNVVTIGLPALIAKGLHPTAKKLGGKAAYVPSAIAAAMKMRRFRVVVEVDGEVVSSDAVQVSIGPGRLHGGSFVFGPDASLTTGKLTGYVLKSSRTSELVRAELAVLFGLHRATGLIEEFSGSEVTVTTVPRKVCVADGEVIGKTPFKISARPRSLKVLTGRDPSL